MIKIVKILILFTCFLLVYSSANSSEQSNLATLGLNSDVKLHMKIEHFIPKEHQMKYCKPAFPVDNWKGVCLIDKKPVFGTDWEMPIYILKEAYVVIKKKKIRLDTSCMYNPWFTGKPDIKNFFIKKTEGGFLINGTFSDGAGAYEAQWFIIDDASVRTKLRGFNE